MGDPSWRLLFLVTITSCSLTAASILVFLAATKHKKPRKRTFTRHASDTDSEDQDYVMSSNRVYLNNPSIYFDYRVGKDGADEFEDVKIVAKEICAQWKDATDDDIAVKIVCGGITNRLYRLQYQDHSVLIRIYGDNTEAFIDRTVENKLFALLSERGFAPTYYGRFANGRIEGWLDARPLEPEEMGMQSPINFIHLIGKELGIMHAMDIPGDKAPVLWSKLQQFMNLALEIRFEDPVKQKRLDALDLLKVEKKLAWLETVLPSELNNHGQKLLDEMDADEVTTQAFRYAYDVVFCHNDALSGNILHHETWDRVQIIDYEYGGHNYRAFDFANHFCENCGFDFDLGNYPSKDKQFDFFASYMQKASPSLLSTLEKNQERQLFFSALHVVTNRFTLASHLFWGLWAVVQAGHSQIDFDFLEYAEARLGSFYPHQKDFFPSK